MPGAGAAAAAASSDCAAEAITATVLDEKRGSPGRGASAPGEARCAMTAAGSFMEYAATMASASARVVASGTVGPEATSAGSSPGMSETTSETTRAGEAAAASRPPLIAETCFLTAFIAAIGAPDASSARLTAISSSSVSSPAGAGSSAEPPPQISATTRSSSVSP